MSKLLTFGFLRPTLYTVHCTLYTVHCIVVGLEIRIRNYILKEAVVPTMYKYFKI